MVVRDSLLRAYVAEHTQLLLAFCTHIFFFLSACTLETRKFSGTAKSVSRRGPVGIQLSDQEALYGQSSRFVVSSRLCVCAPDSAAPRHSISPETGW